MVSEATLGAHDNHAPEQGLSDYPLIMGTRGPKPRPVAERFWEKVSKTETCWLWTGSRGATGYGYIVIEGRKVYAHRWAYESLVGPIPEGLVLDHLCRVRECCNPAHLEPVTQAENMRRGVHPKIVSRVVGVCQSGQHPMTGDNVYEWTSPSGYVMRRCRTCRRLRDRTSP